MKLINFIHFVCSLSVTKKELISFTRDIVLKNEDKTLKVPMEKALLYIDNRELPVSWNKEDLFGADYDSDFDEDKVGNKSSYLNFKVIIS